MITRLSIQNYKGFLNFEMECGAIVFLMGKNGSGKTALFEALHGLAMVISEGDIASFFDSDTRFRFADVEEQRYALDVKIDSVAYRYELDISFAGSEKTPVVTRERLGSGEKTLFLFEGGVLRLYNDSGQEKASFSFNRKKGGLSIVDERPENRLLTKFKEHLGGFMMLELEPAGIEPIARRAASNLDTNGANFAAWYEGQAHADTQVWLEYLRRVQDVVPGLKAINLKPVDRSEKLWEAKVGFNGNQGSFRLDELSNGQICLIVLYAVLYFGVRQGMIVALDEPDNYLGLAEIEPFLYEMEEAAENNAAQVFVISHHPEFYDRWARDADRCRYFERDNAGAFRVRSIAWDEYPGLSPAELVARGWQDA